MKDFYPYPHLRDRSADHRSPLQASRGIKETKFKNTLVLFRRIRIQLLDCRSGDPIPNIPVENIRIGRLGNNSEEKNYVRFAATSGTISWDISKHFPLFQKDGQWLCGKNVPVRGKKDAVLKGMGIASKMALKSLGYKPGSFSEKYDKKVAQIAFLQFKVDRAYENIPHNLSLESRIRNGALKDNEFIVKDDHSYLRAEGLTIRSTPSKEEMEKMIIGEYNIRCFRAMKFYLASLGYVPERKDPLENYAMDQGDVEEDDRVQWSDKWKKVFHQWQKDQKGGNVRDPWDWVKDVDLGKKLMEKAPFVTNNEGVIHIPIPISEFEQGFKLSIAFTHFAIVKEATEKSYDSEAKQIIHRPFSGGYLWFKKESHQEPTGFAVEWGKNQKLGWGESFGWRLGKQASGPEYPLAKFAEFKTAESFEILKPEDGKFENLEELHDDRKCFSMFYDSEENEDPHFVLFALQWCQPVWTETQSDFIWDPALRRPAERRGISGRGLSKGLPTLMVCTKGTPEWSKKYGEYGKEGRKIGGVWHEHPGIDLAGQKGDNVYALTGGKVISTGHDGTGGWRVKVTPWNCSKPLQVYTVRHLHQQSTFVNVNDTVRAGQIIGEMGRSGDFPGVSPTHTHFDCGKGKGRTKGFYDNLPDSIGIYSCVFPHNLLPKILPCDEEYRNLAGADNPIACNAQKAKIANDCWALRELVCPFMNERMTVSSEGKESGSEKAKRRLQAQLKWLVNSDNRNKPAGDFKDPGGIDGDIGVIEDIGEVKSAGLRNIMDQSGSSPLFKTDVGEILPLVSREKVNDRYKLKLTKEHVERYKERTYDKKNIEAGQIVMLHNSSCNVKLRGKTREAIRAFRAETVDEGKEVNPPECYKISNDLLDELDKENFAPLRPQRPSDPIK